MGNVYRCAGEIAIQRGKNMQPIVGLSGSRAVAAYSAL